MEVYNLLSSVAVRIPQEVTVQLSTGMKQYIAIMKTLNDMRKNAVMCDTCIVGSDGYSLYAHACVLAAVCPALRSQLMRKHQANGTNIRISTDSIESEMWERMLRLIYCGEVQIPVCDLITFLDITCELDIQNVQVLYMPVKPTKKGHNLCFVAPNDDDSAVQDDRSKVQGRDVCSSRSTSNEDSSLDKVIFLEKEDCQTNSESTTDACVDTHNHVEGLQCSEEVHNKLDCLDNLTSPGNLSETADHSLQPASVSRPLVDSICVKSEVELDSQDTATLIPSAVHRRDRRLDGSCLLTCKTEPVESQTDISEWNSMDSTMCTVQEADVLAEAFVSSGLMGSTAVFTQISDSQPDVDNHRADYTTMDAMMTRRGRRRQKRFTCNLCQRSFGQMSDLHRHHRVHTGERPYSCNICGVRFTQSTSLRRHLRLLHGVTLGNSVIPRVDVTGVKL